MAESLYSLAAEKLLQHQEFNRANHIIKLRFSSEDYMVAKCSAAQPYHLGDLDGDLTLKFQLLDYEASQYYCFNNTDQLQVDELNCQIRSMSDLAEELHHVTNTVIAVMGSLVGACILGFIIYLKRWHIHYYYSSLKSAALLSSASKESVNKFTNISQRDPVPSTISSSATARMIGPGCSMNCCRTWRKLGMCPFVCMKEIFR